MRQRIRKTLAEPMPDAWEALVHPSVRAYQRITAMADGDGGEGGEGEDGEGEGEPEGEPEGDKDEDKPKGDTITRAEYDALMSRMKAADKRASAAEKKAKDYEDKDKDELTKATERATELEAATKAQEEVIANLRFANAFALSPKYTWHDPSLVLTELRKRDDVSIDEDGVVQGLDKALDDIAKKKPFLVKTEQEVPDEASGAPANGRRTNKGALDDAALAKRFPALARRGVGSKTT